MILVNCIVLPIIDFFEGYPVIYISIKRKKPFPFRDCF